MRKLIVYYGRKYADRLLTIERYQQVSYFVDDVAEEGVYKVGNDEKKIYPVTVLNNEKKDDLIIIISDGSLYSQAKQTLEAMGFQENVHFFNGWRLELPYYKSVYGDNTWEEFEEKDGDTHRISQYRIRAQIMASMIPQTVRSVMDLGCGDAHLKDFLPENVVYYGLDYCRRTDDTLVCDLNHEPLPEIKVDLYYMAGLLYYIDDVDHLIRQISEREGKYILFDYGGIERYLRLDGVPGDRYAGVRNNYLSFEEIFQILIKHGYLMDKTRWEWRTENLGWHMYRFRKAVLC